MTRCRRSLCTWLLVSLLLVPTLLVSAQNPPPPQSPAKPPRPPDSISPPTSAAATETAALSLAPLKAVLLVGPIDGNDGKWTRSEIEHMELAAAELASHGVTVHRFYPGNSNRAQIEAAADGAHFLLYRGHGVYDGNLPHPNVGGFSLSSGYYSPDDIRNNLHLAPGAIVMLYGCFTAGSSGAAGDQYDIGITEARRRVAQYSDPFFDVGAGGYYANWFDDAFQKFLDNLFAGQTLGAAYENYFDFNPSTVHRSTHPDHPGMALWIDKDHWGHWKYNNAFAGRSKKTLEDLFPPAELGGIPASVAFTATVEGDVQVQPESYTITPQNVTGSQDLTWKLSTSGGWFDVAPSGGTTPQGFTITPQRFDTDRPGTYTGDVTVTVTSPSGARNAVQRVHLTLNVRAPELGGLPSSIFFMYSIPEGAFAWTGSRKVVPRNVGSDAALSWTATAEGDTMTVVPTSGATPQAFTITATDFDTATVATYNSALTVNVTDPASVYRSPQVIPVTLRVIDREFRRCYLPLIAGPGSRN